MRFWMFLIISFYFIVCDSAKLITNEDIRDAIVSVVNMIRSSEDKLERHEFREKTLGDHVKKVLATIDKRQRLLDPVKGTIGRLDERLATVETILLQKDERERIQVQKVFDMVEQIHNSLPQLFETLKNDVTATLPKQNDLSTSKTDLVKLQKEIEIKIDSTSKNVKNIDGQLSKIREDNKNDFNNNQKMLENYDNKLTQYNKQLDILQKKCKEVTEAQTEIIVKALEAQNNVVKMVQKEIVASNAIVGSVKEKLLQLEDEITEKYQLNESTNKNLENVHQRISINQEMLKKYEEKLNEYNKKINEIPTTYKIENDAQTKTILKALETQNNNIDKLILTSKKDILKNFETAEKYIKEAFPEQSKERRKYSEEISDTLKIFNRNITDALENSTTTSINGMMKALGNQNANILSNVTSAENTIIKAVISKIDILLELQNKCSKARPDDADKELDTIIKEILNQNVIQEKLNFIANNVTDVFNVLKKHEEELIICNSKIDALPSNQKAENDKQTKIVLDAIESFNVENFKNVTDWRDKNTEVLQAVRKMEENLNKTLLSDTRNKDTYKNFQTFLQAFEKELVFVTNAATANIKDHVDHVAHLELQEFNNKFDEISVHILSENALMQEMKFNVNDAVKMLVEQLKVIENIANRTQIDFKEVIKKDISLNLDAIKNKIKNLDDALGNENGIMLKVNQMSQKNEQQFVELKNVLKENAVDTPGSVTQLLISQIKNSVLQKEFMENLRNKVEDISVQCLMNDKYTQQILEEFTSTYNNTEKMNKKNLEDILATTIKLDTNTKLIIERIKEDNSNVKITLKKQIERVQKDMQAVFGSLFKIPCQFDQNRTTYMQAKIDKAWQNTDKQLQDINRRLEELPSKNLLENYKQSQITEQEIKNNEQWQNVKNQHLNLTILLQQSNEKLVKLQDTLQTLPSKYITENYKQSQFIIEEIKKDNTNTKIEMKNQLEHKHNDTYVAYEGIHSAFLENNKQLVALKETLILLLENNGTKLMFQANKQCNVNSLHEQIEKTVFKEIKHAESVLNETVQQLQQELNKLPTYISVDHHKQTQFIIEAMYLKDKELTKISNLLKTLLKMAETNFNETVPGTLQTIFTKDLQNRNEVKNRTDYATNNFKILTEFAKYQMDALLSIDRALENHSENFKRHVENQTFASENFFKNVEKHLEKLNQNHQNFSSDLRENINNTREIIKYYNKNCERNNNLEDVLQDYGVVTTTGLQNRLDQSQNKFLDLTKQHFDNVSALISGTHKGKTEAVEISRMVNDTCYNVLEIFDKYEAKNSNTQKSIKMIEELTETLNENVAISFERLADEIKGLQKLEEIMVQTSDNVIDTKRRVGNLLTFQMNDFGAYVRKSIDNLQSSLLDNENGAIANITTSLTSDLEHIWRQIGIMHQEMTIIKEIIGKLESNTEKYMNSTTHNDDITSGKVSQLQISTSHINNNLNTLLGRFSLITQEFNQIKVELGNTLNDIKKAMRNPTNPSNPLGPGPHAII